MPEMFTSKLRRVGNSLGVIVPADVIARLGAREGDTIGVVVPAGDGKARNARLLAMAGKYRGASRFVRDDEDRY